MRKLLALLTTLASPALAQTPAGVINAPIYAVGYISQVGGTNVTPNTNKPTAQPTFLSSAAAAPAAGAVAGGKTLLGS